MHDSMLLLYSGCGTVSALGQGAIKGHARKGYDEWRGVGKRPKKSPRLRSKTLSDNSDHNGSVLGLGGDVEAHLLEAWGNIKLHVD